MAGKPAWMTAVAAAGMAVGYAQLPPPQAETPAARLINLNVVAIGAHDQPVADLTADDFTVTDAGKRQNIVFFRRNGDVPRRVATIGPREFTNRGSGRSAHATVILFDRMNDSMGPSGAALDELGHALERVETGSDLYLYYFTKQGKLYPVRPMPGGDTAAPAVRSNTWTRDAKAIIEAANNATFGMRALGIDEGQLIVMTYHMVGVLARQMAEIPGRKSLVWITHGVPIVIRDVGGQPYDFTPYLRRLCAQLDRANVALYPVQQTPPGMATAGMPEAQHSGLGSEDTLQQFADLTGGRASPGGEISAVLQHAMNDVRTSYQIAYQPSDANWNSKFHKLKVTCTRKGVKVQAKTGYFAWPEEAVDEREAFGSLVESPTDAAEIGLRVGATPRADVVHLVMKIDASDVALVRQGDAWTGSLRMAIAAYNAEGQAQVSSVTPFDLKLTAAEREEALKNGMGYEHDVKLGAVVRRVRVIVLDSRLGTAGSVTVPMEKVM